MSSSRLRRQVGLAAAIRALTAQARQVEDPDPPFAVDSGATGALQDLVAALNERHARTHHEQARLAGLQAQAEAASRAKTTFLANLSHELRSPLNAILGFTEMLEQGFYGPVSEEQRVRLGRVRANGESLLALLNEVLDLTRIESGKLPLQWIDLSLPLLLRLVAADVEPAIRAKALGFQLEIDPGLDTICTDVDRLRQILGNLLRNAIQFTRQGRITLRAAPHPTRPDLVRIAVADTGAGITPAAQARIWEEFYQVDPSRRHRVGGAGLGLPISRKLTHLLGGTIWLESTAGVGSCFYVDLPLRPAPGADGAA